MAYLTALANLTLRAWCIVAESTSRSMELHDYGQGAAAPGERKASTPGSVAATCGVKREVARARRQQGTEIGENSSALGNLAVAGVESREKAWPPPLPEDSPRLVGSPRHKEQRTSRGVHPMQDDGSLSKSSLSFILGDPTASTVAGVWKVPHEDKRATLGATNGETKQAFDREGASGKRVSCIVTKQVGNDTRRARRPPSRVCKHADCEQYVVDHGLCVRHGGGKRCQTLGCSSRAKHLGRCWKHGGSTECKVPSCINRAKSRGYCWSHGGGTKCKAADCEKIAISNALCWAHGGGKRCAVEGCMRQAYERTDNLCNNHFQERQENTSIKTGGRH